MAAFTAASSTVAIPSFTGLRAADAVKAAPLKSCSFGPCVAKAAPPMGVSVRASLRDNASKMGAALLAASASVLVAAGGANAMEVLMGGSGGELAFIPNEFSVAAGETITFKNNAGFPHNVVFDEDEIPAGVDVSKISMNEEDLLNAPGETYSVKLDKPGTYKFYCAPHQGTGMKGTVTVS